MKPDKTVLKPTDKQLLDVIARQCQYMIADNGMDWKTAINNAILDHREEHPNWRAESDEDAESNTDGRQE